MGSMRRHAIMDTLPAHMDIVSSVADDCVYRLNELKAMPGVEVTEPAPEVYLAVHKDASGIIISFAAFEWSTEGDDGVEMHLLFTGEGTGGNLREMRHVWWGRDGDGYLFYMPIDKTIAVLTELKKHFDD